MTLEQFKGKWEQLHGEVQQEMLNRLFYRIQIETVEFTCKACFSEGFLHISLDKEKMSFIDIGRGNIE